MDRLLTIFVFIAYKRQQYLSVMFNLGKLRHVSVKIVSAIERKASISYQLASTNKAMQMQMQRFQGPRETLFGCILLLIVVMVAVMVDPSWGGRDF
mgnify:CR=1 FL=1